MLAKVAILGGLRVFYVPYSRKVRVVPKMINIRGPAVTPGAKRAKSAMARSALRSGASGMFSTVLVEEARSWNVTTTTSKRLRWRVSHDQRRTRRRTGTVPEGDKGNGEAENKPSVIDAAHPGLSEALAAHLAPEGVGVVQVGTLRALSVLDIPGDQGYPAVDVSSQDGDQDKTSKSEAQDHWSPHVSPRFPRLAGEMRG